MNLVIRESILGAAPFLVIGDLWLSVDCIILIRLMEETATVQTTYGSHSFQGEMAKSLQRYLENRPNFSAPDQEDKESWQ